MLRFMSAVLSLAISGAALAQAQPTFAIEEGVDYHRLDPAQPTATGKDLEVLEVFSYACIHCSQFQPFVESWKKRLPEGVVYRMMPAAGRFSPTWEPPARAFFAAEVLGKLEEVHQPIFDAIWKNNLQARTIEDFAPVFAEHGVSQEDFLAAARSFAVETKLRGSDQSLPRYRIEGTPTLIINGKWRVVSLREGGFPRMLAAADELIKRELAAAAAKTD